MKLQAITVGVLDTNCYIIEDENNREALIVDPGDNAAEIIKYITDNQLTPKAIVITHGHFDHLGGNRELKAMFDIPLLMHQADTFGLATTDSPPPDGFLNDGDKLSAGSSEFRIIHNPGHSPGGISLYCEKENVLISGDTLFYGTYGRTDLPLSSEKEMGNSLKRLLSLPLETRVFPGHGRPTTIGAEQGLLMDFV